MADNSLLISKYIQKALEDSQEVKAILGNDQHKIFPLLQPDTLAFPFIVHSRNNLTVRYTKDAGLGYGWDNEITYTVSCVSNEYVQCLELANAVRHSLETYHLKDENILIHPIELINVTEYTVENDAFVEELQFRMLVE